MFGFLQASTFLFVAKVKLGLRIKNILTGPAVGKAEGERTFPEASLKVTSLQVDFPSLFAAKSQRGEFSGFPETENRSSEDKEYKKPFPYLPQIATWFFWEERLDRL